VSALEVTLLCLAAVVLAWLLLVLALVAAGRRTEARALARFIPDCVVLLRRLLADERVSRARKLVLLVLVAYLLVPVDLIPDFIPVLGVLDDAIVAGLALRLALREGGPELLREHWPGQAGSLAVVMAAAYGRGAESSTGRR
jgi:uncharacterized membrane protein YkvA (DUF1232 family)